MSDHVFMMEDPSGFISDGIFIGFHGRPGIYTTSDPRHVEAIRKHSLFRHGHIVEHVVEEENQSPPPSTDLTIHDLRKMAKGIPGMMKMSRQELREALGK